MDVVFLGTGGSVPTKARNTSATAVRIGPDVVLFDCGEGTQRQLMSSTVSFMRISRIFISHLHGDHFLGLPGLVQSMNFSGRESRLDIFGPEGTKELTETFLDMGYFECNFQVTGRDLTDEDTVSAPGYKVRAVSVDHTVPSLGYVLQEDPRPGRFDRKAATRLGVPEGPMFSKLQAGRSVKVDGRTILPEMVMGEPRPGLKIAFSGDTRPSDHFAQAISDADLLIHEATVGEALRSKADEFGHSTAKGAASVAAQAHAKILYLNHFSGRYEDVTELVAEAREVFPATYAAEDLMSVQFRHDDG